MKKEKVPKVVKILQDLIGKTPSLQPFKKQSVASYTKKLSLQFAIKTVNSILDTKNNQDPDEVKFTKQWDEFSKLKGYWVDVKYKGGSMTMDLEIMLDITPWYTRVLGDIYRIPKYTPEKHNYPKPEKKYVAKRKRTTKKRKV